MSDERLLEIIEKNDKYYILGFIKGIKANNEILKQENQELKLELSGYRQAILEDKDMLGLKEENQKYKEVFDKAINLIVKETKSMPTNGCKIRLIELLDILKEVE